MLKITNLSDKGRMAGYIRSLLLSKCNNDVDNLKGVFDSYLDMVTDYTSKMKEQLNDGLRGVYTFFNFLEAIRPEGYAVICHAIL